MTTSAVAHLAHLSVGRALMDSRAVLQRTAPLADGAWLAHWRNANTEAEYLQPDHHTLSFYLQGGRAVRCAEAPAARGEPGALCCLPAGHQSRWAVNGQLQLLHLYLPRMVWAQGAERWFDLDPRSATLAERIYFRDPVLEALCARMANADWQAPDASLLLQQLTLDVQARLIAQHTVHRKARAPVRGGLSAPARRRVLECIENGLTREPNSSALTLRAMADAACLSDYHFARMFKLSFACSPHAWVMRRRLELARELLAAGRVSASEVARRCGYAHLSHLNSALKRAGLGSASRVGNRFEFRNTNPPRSG